MKSKPNIFKGEDFTIERLLQRNLHDPEVIFHLTTNGDNQGIISLKEIEALAEWILMRT
tara:strand:+ start:552 stop:728 length:177 start_codon:yes stop_codon:yes gene_type:complete